MHSYTIVDVREVILDNGEFEYMLFMRNPAGNFYLKESEVWKGDWGPTSSKWTQKVRDQLNYHVTEEEMEKEREQQKKELKAFLAGKRMGKKRKRRPRRGVDIGPAGEEELEETRLDLDENDLEANSDADPEQRSSLAKKKSDAGSG